MKTYFYNFCSLIVLPILLLTFSHFTEARTITRIIDGNTGDGNGNLLDGAGDIIVDKLDNVYVLGRYSSNIFKITPDGIVTEIIDETGDGNGNPLLNPGFLAVDNSNNIYVSCTGSKNVFKITPEGEITEIIDGSGEDTSHPLRGPQGICADRFNNIYIAGTESRNFVKITPNGVITEIFNVDVDSDGDGNKLQWPRYIKVDGLDNIYISDQVLVFKITPGGNITKIIDYNGDGAGNIASGISDLDIDISNNVYVSARYSNNAFKITPNGTVTEIIDETGDGNGNILEGTYGITVDGSNNAYVIGNSSHNAFKIAPDGKITEIINQSGDGSTSFSWPSQYGITVDKNNAVSISSVDEVFKIDTNPSIPIANCQNTSIEISSNGQAILDPSQINNESTGDNISLSVNQSVFDCTNLGVNTVTLTVKDEINVTAICTAEVTILNPDNDQDGVTICNGDCDDTDNTIYPGAPELLDGLDNNCDGNLLEAEQLICNGDYFLNGQAEVDAFNCEKVIGNLYIRGDDITDLSSLTTLKSIDGNLQISPCNALTNLDGLSSLNYVGGDLHIQNCNSLTNLDGLSSLNSIGRNLNIHYCEALSGLNGFSALNSIEGTFNISNCEALTNLDGFSSLNSIGNSLSINSCNSLSSLLGLSSLSSIEGGIAISSCNALNNLDGLSSIISVNRLSIQSCTALADMNGLSSLTSLTGDLNISSCDALQTLDGLSLLNSIGGNFNIFSCNSLTELNGLASVNSIQGNLSIVSCGALANLDGLSSLGSISGNLQIRSCDALESVNGLSSLISVEGDLWITSCNTLTNLDGLSSLNDVAGYVNISSCNSLTNLDGLSSMSLVNGNLSVRSCPVLVNLDGLSALNSIEGSLSIGQCNALTNLDGLSSISSVNGDVSIQDCGALTNMSGLSSLNSMKRLWISSCTALSNLDGLSSLISLESALYIISCNALTNLDGLSNLVSVNSDIYISDNNQLTEFCGLHNLISGDGLGGNFTITNNALNPTQQEIVNDGPCIQLPNAICQNTTLELDENGEATLDPAEIDGGSTGENITLSVSQVSFDCTNIGENTVTLTVTDDLENIATCDATVTVVDNILPVAIAQNVTVYLDEDGNGSTSAEDINNESSDACGILSLELDKTDFTCDDITANPNVVTLTVTDNNDNVSTATAEVTVVDDLLPNVIVQDISVELDANGEATITATEIDDGSTDNCGIASMALDITDFDCSMLGDNVVSLTVTDDNGNSESAQATVTVEDKILPVARAKNIVVSLNNLGLATIMPSDIDDGSSDNCSIDQMTLSNYNFTQLNLYIDNEVTLTVTDPSGNSSTANATVTVIDELPPTVITQNITVPLDALGIASITPNQVDNGSDDSGGISDKSLNISSFVCDNIGENTVTLSVTDNSSNTASGDAIVTIVDPIAPEAITQDISIDLDASGTASISAGDVDDGSNDACGIASLSVSPSSFDCSNVGANTVTLTVTDNNGNVSSATATVTVNDVTLPQPITQNISVDLDASGTASISGDDVDGGSSDACGIASLAISPSSFDCSNIGPNTVTLTVTDNSGNVNSATATVNVNDLTLPTAIAKDITIQLDADGNAVITAGQINNGSADACGIATLIIAPSSFDCSNVGANTVALVVTDNNGNINTATAIVTVNDVTTTAIAKDITIQLDADGNATITPDDVNNGSADACGILSMELSKTAFTCADIASNPNVVTLTVTDNNNNVSTATAEVTVVDDLAPNVVARDISVELDANGTTSISASDVNNGSTDACGIASLSVSPNSFDCSNIGANTVTLTVADNNGNISSATAIVTVNDVTTTAIAKDITVQLNEEGNADIAPADVNNGSAAACGILSMELSKTAFTCADIASNPNVVTLTVTDNNSNVSTAAAEVTVVDDLLPNVITQDIVIQLDANGEATITPDQIDNGSSDACGIATYDLSITEFGLVDIGDNSVVLTVTDNNGNIATQNAVVTVSIPVVNIPDANFKAALIANTAINTNGDSEIQVSEAIAFTGSIDVKDLGISDMTGLEAFTSLIGLNCSLNSLNLLDVSSNSALTNLSCYSNQLRKLDVSANTELLLLHCGSNQLSSLDISANTALTGLNCTFNQLNTLDVTENIALWYLHCDSNQLSSLDISSNITLSKLSCSSNQLNGLDVSGNEDLTVLSCSSNQLSSLDVSSNTALTGLYCSSNQLSSLDLSTNSDLQSLRCAGNQLTSLDVRNENNGSITLFNATGNPMLSCISVSDVDFATANWVDIDAGVTFSEDCDQLLDVVNIPDTNFKAALIANAAINTNGDNEIQVSEAEAYSGTMDVSNQSIADMTGLEAFTSLKGLLCNGNSLTKLDVSKNTALTVLECYSNQLSSLDVSQNTALNSLTCAFNQLTELDVSQNTSLILLNCDGNQLAELDVFQNSALTFLYCQNNVLNNLDISRNTALSTLLCLGNQLSELNISYNTSLIQLDCRENQIAELDVSQNKALTELGCGGNLLNSLDISQNAALSYLVCGFNQLSILDVSQNTELQYLHTSNNPLGSLDVSANTALTGLYCSSNQLSSLDVSTNSALQSLWCDGNQLISLDVRNGNNSLLTEFNATSNPDLNCISVSDVDFATANWTDIDAGVTFSEDCDLLLDVVNIPDANFKAALIANTAINTNGDSEIQVNEAEAFSGEMDVSNQGISDMTGLEAFTALTILNCANNSISSLDVSANLTLTWLNCDFNQLGSLDVSQNTALSILLCGKNQLTELDVFQNTKLEGLYCYGNHLANLDVSQNTALTVLDCQSTQLTSLDISQNTALRELWCTGSPLTNLDVSQNTALKTLICHSNQLTRLDVSQNILLDYLSCGGNQLITLELSQNTLLRYLGIGGNQLTSLDVTKNITLEALDCQNNRLAGLDVSQNVLLTHLSCLNNQLADLDVRNGNNNLLTEFNATSNPDLNCISVSDLAFATATWTNIDAGVAFSEDCDMLLDVVNIPDANFKAALIANAAINTNGDSEIQVSEAEAFTGIIDVQNLSISDMTGLEAFTNLTRLNCYGNSLSSLDVGANIVLEELNCDSNQLSSLDVSSNTGLIFLACGSNQLSSLDLSTNTKLRYFTCSYNPLNNLNISANTALQSLYCSSNQLSSLDVSSNTVLTYLDCSSNQLNSLDVRNGNNHLLTEFYASNNPPLSCISVSDVTFATANWTDIDAGVTFNEDCDLLLDVVNIPDANFKAALIANSAINTNGDSEIQVSEAEAFSGTMYVQYLSISDMTGLEAFTALTGLNCSNNSLSSLDVSANTALTNLSCNTNQLSSLDVTTNTVLILLSCGANQLTSLDVSKNAALTWLGCDDNELSSLDVTTNTALIHLDCGANQLSSLDVSANTELTWLECRVNQLSSLDVTTNTALIHLDCHDNQLSNLDVSTNMTLTDLRCNRNQLSVLDVTTNTALIHLSCHANQLSSLDVSMNAALQILHCESNRLSNLDVRNGNNHLLTEFNASNNPSLSCISVSNVDFATANWVDIDAGVTFSEDCDLLLDVVNIPDANFKAALIANAAINTNGDSEIQVSEAEAFTGAMEVNNQNISDMTGLESFINLTGLNCYGNSLISLDVSANTALTILNCHTNQLSNLDVSTNTVLTSLICDTNQLSSLDVSTNTALSNLYCGSNQLSSLDVSTNTALTRLYCPDNQLSSLDVSANSELTLLVCDINQLSSLDVSTNTSLTSLYCSHNQLSSLDVSANSELTSLACTSNQLSSLDVSTNTALSLLNCGSNQLSSLDVSTNTVLTRLYCSHNQLSSLDVSTNTALSNLYCGSNQLSSLDVRNENNGIIGNFSAINNPDLHCINVSDVAFAAANWTEIDAGVTFNEDCDLLLDVVNIPDTNFKEALVANALVNTNGDSEIQVSEASAFSGMLNVYNLSISDMTGLEAFTSLTGLNCSINPLSILDVSSNTTLTSLSCYSNQLKNLDLSANTALIALNCSSNQLSILDLSTNSALQTLWCAANQLTSLNVSANSALVSLYCYSNLLISLDVHANAALQILRCESNQFMSLVVKNGNNNIITEFNARNNPSLSCIEVDNVSAANDGLSPYTTWLKDASARYSENCSHNTDVGEDVAISLIEPATGSTNVDVIFQDVTTSGNTTLETDNTGPEIPDGFAYGDPLLVFNIETTAEYSGVIQVAIDYSGIIFENEAGLRVFHYESGQWIDVTTQVDIEADMIYGEVLSLSPFVILEDKEPPVASAKDLTIQLDETGNAVIEPEDVDNESSDASGIASLSLSQTDFDCSHVGANTVTLTVTDVYGNSSTATATITVEDKVPPVAIAQDLTIQLDDEGKAEITSAQINNGSSDACGIALFEISPSEFGCDNIGENVVVLTVTDNNGNTASTEAIVTVSGIIPEVNITQSVLPEFCQGAVLLLTANSDDAIAYDWLTGAMTQVAEVSTDGSYAVTVTSATNCKATGEYAVSGFDAGALISSYTILARDEVHLHGYNLVASGGVGVTKEGKTAKLHESSQVIDFVQASEIEIADGSAVGTEIFAPASVLIPKFIDNNRSRKRSPDRKVKKNKIVTLSKEVYGKVEIDEGATVIFSGPNIYIEELKTKKNASIEFEGCANLYIKKSLKFEMNTIFNSNGNSVVVYVDDKVEIKEGSMIAARIHANDNDIKVKGKDIAPTTMNGMFIGKKIHGDKYVTWNMDRFCATCPPPVLPFEDIDSNVRIADAGSQEKEFDEFRDISIYPNPVTKLLTIQTPDGFVDEEQTMEIHLFSMTGVDLIEFTQRTVINNGMEIDVEDLPAGIYILMIPNGETTFKYKLNKL